MDLRWKIIRNKKMDSQKTITITFLYGNQSPPDNGITEPTIHYGLPGENKYFHNSKL